MRIRSFIIIGLGLAATYGALLFWDESAFLFSTPIKSCQKEIQAQTVDDLVYSFGQPQMKSTTPNGTIWVYSPNQKNNEYLVALLDVSEQKIANIGCRTRYW